MTLTELGRKYGTDKVDQHHEFWGDTYCDIYHKYLQHLRDEEFNFLEIGVRDGKSIKMWAEYFPKATIVGLDIDPTCKQYEGGNVEIHIGSQDDVGLINGLLSKYENFRVVLDDGSHINSLTMDSFRLLNKHTTEWYIIEDLRNSYEDLTEDVKHWPGMHLNQNLNANNSLTRPEFNSRLLDIIKMMDYRIATWTGVHFHAQMVLLQKGKVG
jgi:hypothetical protein